MWETDERDFVHLKQPDSMDLRDIDRRKRPFRDIPCVLLFMGVLGMCAMIIAIAFTYGNPAALPSPTITWLEDELETFTINEISILKHDLPAITIALLIALLLAFMWFQLFKRLTLAIVYSTLAFATTALILLGVYLFVAGSRNHTTELKFIATFLWAVSASILFVGYMLWNKMKFTAQIIRQAGEVLQKNPVILTITATTCCVYLITLLFWILSFIYLYSVPNTAHFLSVVDSTVIIRNFFNENYQTLFWILLAGGLWVLPMIHAIEQYVIASVVIQEMEFIHQGRTRRRNVALTAAKEAFSTSFGSLAFGSSLIAITQIIAVVAKYLKPEGTGSWRDNFFVRLVLRFMTFLLEVVTDFSFINVALTGNSFIQSSREIMKLLSVETARTILLEIVLSYVLLLGQLCGTAIITLFTIYVIEAKHLHVGVISVIVISISTFLLFSVISKAILVTANTILVFTINDLTMDHDSNEFKTPSPLKDIVIAQLLPNKK